MPKIKAEKYIFPVIVLTIFLLLWHGISVSGRYTEDQLPGPVSILKGFVEIWKQGVVFDHLRASFKRLGMAYALGVLTAIPLGLIFGWYGRLYLAIEPFVHVLRPISPIAWFPLAVLWFKIGDPPAIFIIFLSVFFPVLLSTITAVRNVPPAYIKTARNFGSTERDILLKVVIPASFPYITVGLHIALGLGWINLVAGEMLGAQSGLGFLILDSRNFLRTDLIICGMLLVGFFGLLLDRLMRLLERRVNKTWGFQPGVD